MNEAIDETTKDLLDDIVDAIRRERENVLTPNEEKLRLRYTSALVSMNRLTEREAGQLLQSAHELGF